MEALLHRQQVAVWVEATAGDQWTSCRRNLHVHSALHGIDRFCYEKTKSKFK